MTPPSHTYGCGMILDARPKCSACVSMGKIPILSVLNLWGEDPCRMPFSGCGAFASHVNETRNNEVVFCALWPDVEKLFCLRGLRTSLRTVEENTTGLNREIVMIVEIG